MHSTPDPGPTSPVPAGTPAGTGTFLDALRGLGFTAQDPHPDALHTTLHRDDGDPRIVVHYHRGDFDEPSDHGDCHVEIVCVDHGGFRDLWQATISHLDALPLALTLLRAAVGGDR